MVSCIIPAYNEAPTIENVLNVLSTSPLIDEIIVVDDGSTDNTEKIVKDQFPFVKYIKHSVNKGKAAALVTGAHSAVNSYLFFCDADLIGLTPAHIDQLIIPVLYGDTHMTCGIQEFINPFGNSRWFQIVNKNKPDSIKKTGSRLNEFILGLGGEKVLRKEDFLQVQDIQNSDYGVEHKVIEYFRANNLSFEYHILKGVGHRHKITKWGFKKGLTKELKAYVTFMSQHSGGLLKSTVHPSFRPFRFRFRKGIIIQNKKSTPDPLTM